MAVAREHINASEPVGIVISRGERDEPTPCFRAYIWGPPPDDRKPSTAEPRAA